MAERRRPGLVGMTADERKAFRQAMHNQPTPHKVKPPKKRPKKKK